MIRRRWLTQKQSAQLDLLRVADMPQVFLSPDMTPAESADYLERMATALRQNYRLQTQPFSQQRRQQAGDDSEH
ncbi:hypothetical protein [Salinicola aestuarinus]|uniref:hypothetical protein n=1 Tax=Salinicola aestuarinus TaxID=1949082 RepID=UPI000DA1D654|nr:hypothetical protein [Salinicola aestuarinus]